MKTLAVLLLTAFTLAAQESTEPSRGPDAGTEYRLHGIQVLPASGRPFSGRDHIVWTRTLDDGSVVTTELYATVARDSQGRIYREHRSFVPLNTNQKSKWRDIVLLDPVAHSRTTCVIARRRCTIYRYRPPTRFVPPADGSFDESKRYLSRENLGSNELDDLNVIGTRETISIAPGAVGNSQAMATTREFWYSPDLQINLSVVRKDPRIGTQTLQIVDLSRADPNPALFQPPSDFAMDDLRQPAKPSGVLPH
jgi:hypothetical protein